MIKSSDTRFDNSSQDLSTLPDFLVLGVEQDVPMAAQWPRSPLLKHFVQLGRGTRDLTRADIEAAQLLDDRLDPPRGHALDIHLRHG